MPIYVDVDGVVADLHPVWLAAYNHEYQDTLELESFTHWGWQNYVKPECGSKVHDYLTGELYDRVAPVEGAYDAICGLRNLGLRLVFLTSCVRGTTDAKIEWLVNHRFLRHQDRTPMDFVSCRDKSLLAAPGVILIDDGLHNVIEWDRAGGTPIVVDQPWNRLHDDNTPVQYQRVRTWNEISSLLS